MAHSITTAISFTYGQLELLHDALIEQVAYEHALLLANPEETTRYEQAQTALNKVEKALKRKQGDTYAGDYYRNYSEKFI